LPITLKDWTVIDYPVLIGAATLGDAVKANIALGDLVELSGTDGELILGDESFSSSSRATLATGLGSMSCSQQLIKSLFKKIYHFVLLIMLYPNV
jgi:hypothetical protein